MTRFSRLSRLSPCWKRRSERGGEIAYLFMNVGGKSNPWAEIKSHFRGIFFEHTKRTDFRIWKPVLSLACGWWVERLEWAKMVVATRYFFFLTLYRWTTQNVRVNLSDDKSSYLYGQLSSTMNRHRSTRTWFRWCRDTCRWPCTIWNLRPRRTRR